MKSVVRRVRASVDLDEAALYYAEEGGVPLAARFLDAVEAGLAHVARHPGTGSLRYARLLPEGPLRFWLLDRFPNALFYVEREDRIELLRVLHQSADLPAHLTNESDLS